MARSETNVVHTIILELARISVLFKNVRGKFWSLDKKRVVMAGLLASGASDLIGITSIRITPEMVGRVMGVFTAFEVKTKDGKPSEEQVNFMGFVADSGGITGVCRSPEDAKKIISDFIK